MKFKALISALVCCNLFACGFAAEPISGEKFDQFMTLIQPQKSEGKWTAIPWMLDLWAARKKAAELGKPILLWEMDGHPLGCV